MSYDKDYWERLKFDAQHRRMRERAIETAAWFTVAAIILGFLVGGYAWQRYACEARWAPTSTEYNLVAGCRVYEGGRFVPERAMRVLP